MAQQLVGYRAAENALNPFRAAVTLQLCDEPSRRASYRKFPSISDSGATSAAERNIQRIAFVRRALPSLPLHHRKPRHRRKPAGRRVVAVKSSSSLVFRAGRQELYAQANKAAALDRHRLEHRRRTLCPVSLVRISPSSSVGGSRELLFRLALTSQLAANRR